MTTADIASMSDERLNMEWRDLMARRFVVQSKIYAGKGDNRDVAEAKELARQIDAIEKEQQRRKDAAA